MALYVKSAFPKPVVRISTGLLPQYLFGSFDSHTIPFRFAINHMALASNVVTATVALVGGGGGQGGAGGALVNNPMPVVGSTMGVRGTTTDSGALNLDPVTVTGVSLNANGVGTLTYAGPAGTQVTTADKGEIQVLPYEYPDIVVSGSASAPVALAFTPDESDNSRCLFAEANWSGTMPSAATVVLEVANVDQDGRYYVAANNYGCSASGIVASSDALATIAGSSVTQNGAEYSFLMAKFVRAKVLSMTGGDSSTGLVVSIFC
jgi:hypothetical protein